MEIICNECGEISEGSNIQLKVRNLRKHLINSHNIIYIDYIIKYDYNGIRPTCYCGCSKDTEFHHGKFRKYYKDHKNNIKGYKQPQTIKNEKEVLSDIENRLNSVNLTIEDIKKYYLSYINFEESINSIKNKIFMDKRTLVSYWEKLNLINNKDDFNRIGKKHRGLWPSIKPKKDIPNDILLDIKLFIDSNKNRFTLNEIISKFNLDISRFSLFKKLTKIFSEEDIKNSLKSGLSSKPELEYFNILKYFYKNDIKKQFRLEGKHYDYILLDKILIEFDGDYWHSNPEKKEKDREKDRIAIKNGYYIIRISDKNSNNIEILNKINEIYEKVKSNRNIKKEFC